jgi:hypothetical protein
VAPSPPSATHHGWQLLYRAAQEREEEEIEEEEVAGWPDLLRRVPYSGGCSPPCQWWPVAMGAATAVSLRQTGEGGKNEMEIRV